MGPHLFALRIRPDLLAPVPRVLQRSFCAARIRHEPRMAARMAAGMAVRVAARIATRATTRAITRAITHATTHATTHASAPIAARTAARTAARRASKWGFSARRGRPRFLGEAGRAHVSTSGVDDRVSDERGPFACCGQAGSVAWEGSSAYFWVDVGADVWAAVWATVWATVWAVVRAVVRAAGRTAGWSGATPWRKRAGRLCCRRGGRLCSCRGWIMAGPRRLISKTSSKPGANPREAAGWLRRRRRGAAEDWVAALSGRIRKMGTGEFRAAACRRRICSGWAPSSQTSTAPAAWDLMACSATHRAWCSAC